MREYFMPMLEAIREFAIDYKKKYGTDYNCKQLLPIPVMDNYTDNSVGEMNAFFVGFSVDNNDEVKYKMILCSDDENTSAACNFFVLDEHADISDYSVILSEIIRFKASENVK